VLEQVFELELYRYHYNISHISSAIQKFDFVWLRRRTLETLREGGTGQMVWSLVDRLYRLLLVDTKMSISSSSNSSSIFSCNSSSSLLTPSQSQVLTSKLQF